MPRIAFLLLAAGLLFAEEETKDEHRLQPDHALTPYTAAEIRDACLEGRTSTFLLKVAKKDPVRRTFLFTNCTESGTDLTLTTTDEDGKVVGQPTTQHATWKQLQAHGSYPESSTRISKAMIHLPAGKFDCHLYVVTKKGPDTTSVTRVYFAKDLPGPPVMMEMEVNGNVTFKMTLIEHKDGKKKEPAKPEPKPETEPKPKPEKE